MIVDEVIVIQDETKKIHYPCNRMSTESILTFIANPFDGRMSSSEIKFEVESMDRMNGDSSS